MFYAEIISRTILVSFLLNSEVQVIICQINIFCHQLTQIMTICVNLHEFDQISHCILSELVTKYVDLTKNTQYVDDNKIVNLKKNSPNVL
jgi:hypothetical protein